MMGTITKHENKFIANKFPGGGNGGSVGNGGGSGGSGDGDTE